MRLGVVTNHPYTSILNLLLYQITPQTDSRKRLKNLSEENESCGNNHPHEQMPQRKRTIISRQQDQRHPHRRRGRCQSCGGLKAPAPQKAQEEVQWLQQIQPPIWAEQHKELGIE